MRDRETLYQTILDTSQEGVWLIDANALTIYVNRRMAEMLGYSVEEMLGRAMYDFMDAAARAEAEGNFERRRSGVREQHDFRLRRKDGTELWSIMSTNPILGEDGEFRGALAMVTDITERKRTEDQLHQREMQLAAAQQIAHLGSWEWDIASDRTVRSDEIYRIYGVQPQEFGPTYSGFLSLVHADDRDRVRQVIETSLRERNRFSFEFRIVRPDGTMRALHSQGEVICDEAGEPVRMLGVAQDITDRKRAEEVLRESEARFRTIFEETGSGNCLSDLQGQILETNRAMQEMLGYSADELRSMLFTDFTHPDCVDGELSLLQELVAGKRQSYQVEKRCLRKDGEAIWVRVIVSLIRDAEGKPLYLCGAAENITERKRAEEAQRASRQQYESLVESINGIVWEADPQTFNFTFVSKQAERILGYPLKQWLDEPNFWSNHLHSEDREKAVSYCLDSVARKANHQFEYRMIAMDGRVVWFRDIVTLNVMEDKSIRLRGILVDITELEREKDARMSLLRRLVGAQEEERYHIARELHDHVGQYTAAFMMGLKSLQNSTGLTPTEQRQVVKLQELTSQFSQEVRRFSLDLRPAALDDFGLHVALSHYIEEWSKRNDIQVDFHNDDLINKRFPPQIETALYRLTQEALNNVLKHAQAKRVSVILEYREGRVLAVLEDDGTGFDVTAALDAPVSERGLGLTGMHERIESVGGRLEIESAPGLGTTIVARIPTTSYKQSNTSE